MRSKTSNDNYYLLTMAAIAQEMDPLFHTGYSISDSLKTVRKSVLIYETIIVIEVLPK